jgi:hypothetical protein
LYVVKDRPFLSSERTFHIKKPAAIRQKEMSALKSQMVAGYQDIVAD